MNLKTTIIMSVRRKLHTSIDGSEGASESNLGFIQFYIIQSQFSCV